MIGASVIFRQAEAAVREALQDTPVVLIHGPRQAGKSTLARSITAGDSPRRYITLDDPIPRLSAIENPAAFLETYKEPVVIDEVQRAPGLFLAIKAAVDRDRSPGRFLLTGSANVLALPKIADSLAGRMAIVDLLPLSQAEFAGKPSQFIDLAFKTNLPNSGAIDNGDLVDRIVRGGFPEPSLRASAARRDVWFEDYVRTLLERDVRDIANIEALNQMPRLLELIASRSGSTLNVVSLSRDTGIPNTTLHRYLDMLRAVFLVQDVLAWSSDLGARLTKTPKAYIVDTGLLCYLDNLTAGTLQSDRQRFAQALENFVALELRKMAPFSERRPKLYHLRTLRQLEVDFVLEARGGDIVGIDVRNTQALGPHDADGLRFLRELAGDKFRGGVVLYTGDEIQPIDPQIVGMPIASLWSV